MSCVCLRHEGLKDKSQVDLHCAVVSMNEAPSLPRNHESLTHRLTNFAGYMHEDQ